MEEFNIEINTGQSVQSIRDMRDELRELRGQMAQAEGEEFIKLSERASELNADLGRTNSLITSSGSAFTNFNSLLGRTAKSLLTLDFGAAAEQAQALQNVSKKLTFKEMTTGLKQARIAITTMGKAILANPILLLAAVVIGIGIALYKLKDSVAIIGVVFDMIGKVIDGVIQLLKDFADWIGLTSFAEEEAAAKAEKAAERRANAIKVANAEIEGAMTREIALMKAQGASIEDIEDKEIELAKTKAQNFLTENRANMVRLKTLQVIGAATDAQIKQLSELNEEMLNLINEVEVREAQVEANRKDRREKAAADALAAKQKELAQIEAEEAKAEAERIAREQRTAKFIEGLKRKQYEINNKAIEDEIEANRLLQLQKLEWAQQDIDFTKMTDEAKLEWQTWYDSERVRINKEANDAILAAEEKRKKEEDKLREEKLRAEQSLQTAKIDAAFTTLGISKMIAGENEKVANAIFAVEQGLAAGEIITDAIKRKTLLMSQLAAGTARAAVDPIGGGAMIAGAKAGLVSLATSTAAGLAGIAGASINKFKGGGGMAPSMGGSGGGMAPTVMSAPQPSFSNFTDDFAGNIGGGSESLGSTYIIDSELSSNDEKKKLLKMKKQF